MHHVFLGIEGHPDSAFPVIQIIIILAGLGNTPAILSPGFRLNWASFASGRKAPDQTSIEENTGVNETHINDFI